MRESDICLFEILIAESMSGSWDEHRQIAINRAPKKRKHIAKEQSESTRRVHKWKTIEA